MAVDKKVIHPKLDVKENSVTNNAVVFQPQNSLIINFSKFKLEPICLHGKFNNHFKDKEHFEYVVGNFLGIILPKITSHNYNEICEGGREGQMLHFHTVDENHRKIVREILEKYQYPDHRIDQMFEGNDIVEFSACLGHKYAARIVCHKVKNVLHLLFFDTNHHIYMNEKYTKETLFYEDCPMYLDKSCQYMPEDCFAAGYLDEELMKNSFDYSFSPQL